MPGNPSQPTPPDRLVVQPGSNLKIPWAFVTPAPGGDAHDAVWASDASAVTEVLDIPWSYYTDSFGAGYVLGYSKWTRLGLPGTPGVIRRTLPMQHPAFPWLWATRISGAKGLKWLRKNTAPTGGRYVAGPYSDYDRARLTVVFQA